MPTTRPKPEKDITVPSRRKTSKFIGTNGDSPNGQIPKGGDYTSKGIWKNSKGVAVARSDQEDSMITAHKSTGEDAPNDFTKAAQIKRNMTMNKPPIPGMPNLRKAAAIRRRKGVV